MCPQLCEFFKHPLTWVDIVAILPLYMEVILASFSISGTAVFRVVRLVRVFRLFKMTRYLSWLNVVGRALRQSAAPLGMIVFMLSLGVVFFSASLYYMERGDYDDRRELYVTDTGARSPFQSIPATFWW